MTTPDFDRAAVLQRVRETIASQRVAAIIARIPAPTPEQIAILNADPLERERVMREFGDSDLFFEWLKSGDKGVG